MNNIVKKYDAIFYKPKLKIAKLIIGQVQSGKTTYMIEKAVGALTTDFDVVIILGGNTNILLNQTIKRFREKFKSENFNIFDIAKTEYLSIPNGKTIITSLKNKNSLELLIELLKNSDSKKVLFLDDESDYGGINIGGLKKSLLYSYLKKINSLIYKGEYLSITATPFADILSEDAIKFDELIVLPLNVNYTGLTYFNNSNIYKISEVDVKIRNLEKNENIWRDILISHIKRIYESKLNATQLLFNIDLSTQIHIKLLKKIFEILREIDISWKQAIFPNYDPIKITEIVKELRKNLFLLNGENTIWNSKSHSILIGGVLVSRGYTFKHLLTTIMFNEPKEKIALDVLLQRARWFGYRQDFSKYMKVYASEKVINAFFESERIINEMEKLISKYPKNQEIIKDFFKSIKLENIILTNKK